MSNISLSGLKTLAQNHVIEVRFVRRTKNRLPRKRRMLLTLDRTLLNSTQGLNLLKFKKPTQSPSYDAASKKLLFVWDLIMQDWRAVPAENLNIVYGAFPMRTSPNSLMFWNYYNLVLVKMSISEKAAFMDQ
jgi:hypothetical protein